MENILVRKPQFAGLFYPEEAQVLRQMIEEFLNRAVFKKPKKNPKALIAPHAGYLYSGPVAAYAYKTIKGLNFEKIILLGPSHHFAFNGLLAADFKIWQTPLGELESLTIDSLPIFKKEISSSSEIHLTEHCLEVQLPFLQVVINKPKILPLLTSQNEIKKSVKILDKIIDPNTLLIVSSDLSHYYPYQTAQQLDKVTIDAILDQDLSRFKEYGEACGKKAIEILLALSKVKKWEPNLLCYLNSGDTSGDKNQVVGYTSIVFY